MWQFMKDNPDVFTGSNQEGIQRVKNSNGKYAFFMESSSIEYVVERECDLAQVGGLLDAKGYGIAMRKSQFSQSNHQPNPFIVIIRCCRFPLSKCDQRGCVETAGSGQNVRAQNQVVEREKRRRTVQGNFFKFIIN